MLIDKYVSKFDSENTKKGYRAAVRKFLDFKFGESEKGYEDLAERYFNELQEVKEEAREKGKSDYEARKRGRKQVKIRIARDLSGFIDHLSDDLTASSIRNYSGKVKRFIVETLYEEGIFLDKLHLEEEWKNLRRRKEPLKKRRKTRDRIPSYEELREILKNTDLMGRTLFLMMASSGMRIGEMLELKKGDIEFLDSGIGKVKLRADYTKNKEPKTTFISREAVDELKKWLKAKKDKKKKNGESFAGKTIFPVSQRNVRAKLNKALEEAGLDERNDNGRRKIHPHSLRKFFRTKLVNSKHINRDHVEKLMGHKGYLTDSYVRLREEELAERYRKAQRYVTVFERGVKWEDMKELRETAKEQEKKIEALKKRLDERNGRIKELERKLEEKEKEKQEREDKVERLSKQVQDLAEKVEELAKGDK